MTFLGEWISPPPSTPRDGGGEPEPWLPPSPSMKGGQNFARTLCWANESNVAGSPGSTLTLRENAFGTSMGLHTITVVNDFKVTPTVRAAYDAARAGDPYRTLHAYVNCGETRHEPLTAGGVLPLAAYARTTRGTNYYLNNASENFSELWLTSRVSPEWDQALGDEIAADIAAALADGTVLDVAGTGPAASAPTHCEWEINVGRTNGTTRVRPMNPATGAQYTVPEYIADMVGMLTRARARFKATHGAAEPFMGNAFGFGDRWFGTNADGPTRLIAAPLDGGVFELFGRRPQSAIGGDRSQAALQRDVDAVMECERIMHKAALCVMKVWLDKPAGTTDEEWAVSVNRWLILGWAMFLLGAEGQGGFAFQPREPGPSNAEKRIDDMWQAWYAGLDVGEAISVYRSPGGGVNPNLDPSAAIVHGATGVPGVYDRDYTNDARVIANLSPTTSAVYSLPAGSTWQRIDTGATVAESFTLPGRSGMLLRRVA